jgi:hypothetical protein
MILRKKNRALDHPKKMELGIGEHLTYKLRKNLLEMVGFVLFLADNFVMRQNLDFVCWMVRGIFFSSDNRGVISWLEM